MSGRSRGSRQVFVVYMGLVGCGGESEPEPAVEAGPPKEAWELIDDDDDHVSGNLMVQQAWARPPTHGEGTEHPFVTALARPGYRLGVVEVFASTTSFTCDDWDKVRGKETTVQVTLVDPPRDGARKWEVSDVDWTHWSMGVGTKVVARVREVGSEPGGVVRLDLETAFAGTTWDKPWMHVKGPIEATLCEADPIPFPKETPQAGVSLTVGGVALPVLGALIQEETGGERLLLSTQPMDCSFKGDRAWLTLGFAKNSFLAKGAWSTWAGSPLGEVTFGPAGGATRTFEVDAALSLGVGAPHLGVVVSGRGSATVCPK